MGWLISIVFTYSGIYYNIEKDCVQVKLETIETEYQALELFVGPIDNIKRPKYRGLYTCFFKLKRKIVLIIPYRRKQQSSFISTSVLEANQHQDLHGVKQVIIHAKNMIHALSLEKFDNNINSLVTP